jgi:uncharacterized Tic20 family protein
MIGRLIYALAIGIVVALVLLLIGTVIQSLDIPIFSTIGAFLEQWCWVLGFLAAVLSFFGGGFPSVPNRP